MDLPKVGAKIEGDIHDLMLKLAETRAAVKAWKRDVAAPVGRMDIGDQMDKELKRIAKSLKSNIIKDALKDAFKADDIAAKEGESAAKAFARNWKAQMKKERYNVRNWLPLVGAGMFIAPGLVSGGLGAAGGFATAGIGAAAGLGALAASAGEILNPVKQAFTTIDKLTTSNQMLASASALQQWATGTTVTKGRAPSSTFSAGLLQARITAEQARISANQQRLAAASTPAAAAGYRADILGERATLAGYQARLAAGPGGTGPVTTRNQIPAGFGFLTNPNVNWYTMNPAQRRRTVMMAQTSMTGQPKALKDQINALMQERQAYVGLDAGQRKALYSYQQFDAAMVKSQNKSQPIVLKLWAQGLQILTPLLKYFHPLAQAAGNALSGIFVWIKKITDSGAFKEFMNQLVKMAGVGTKGFGDALVNIGLGFMHLFTAFSKSGLAKDMMNWLDGMAKGFANWTAGKGLSDFMKVMKQDGPTTMKILRNLLGIIGNILKSTTGGFGSAELKFFNLLLAVLNKLTSIPGIGPFIYNMIALELLFSKLGSLKATTALWDIFYKTMGKVLGLKISKLAGDIFKVGTDGKKAGEIWKAIGGKFWTGINSAIRACWALGKQIVVTTAKVIARGAMMVAGWIIQMGAWLASTVATALGIEATMTGVVVATGGIVLAIGLIVLGIYELYKHWHTVWTWIKRIAKDAWDFIWNGFGKWLLPLLGPAGLIVLGVIEVWKHWKTIWNAIKSFTEYILRFIVDKFTGWAIDILKAADFAFGWVPGLGGKLKGATKALEKFRDDANAALGGVKSHRIDMAVYLAASKRDVRPGGFQEFHAAGGPIRGGTTGTADDVPIRASRGEWVIKESSASKYGPGAMSAVNRGTAVIGYAKGGMVTVGGEGNYPGLHVSVTTPTAENINSQITPILGKMAMQFAKSMLAGSGAAIVDYARSFVGKVPYVWGGTTPAGWDCSGFTGYVYKHFGYQPPRTSQQQQLWAKPSGNVPGALVFFYGRGGSASHVGIATGGSRYIGADDVQIGTAIQPVAGNTGFGIPPGGFRGNAWNGPIGPGIRGWAIGLMNALGYKASSGSIAGLEHWAQMESGGMGHWNNPINTTQSGFGGRSMNFAGVKMYPTIQQGIEAEAVTLRSGLYGSILAALRNGGRGLGSAVLSSPWGTTNWSGGGLVGYGTGTASASPGWAILGDYGPEAVRMRGGEQVMPYRRGFERGPRGAPINITVVTQEINPQYHAARLGFELARRVG